MEKKGKRGFGPGLIISAAFVGPGTVIACTAAGANYGVTLLWTLLFAGITTFVLQEMSMRLSLATGEDLASAIHSMGGFGHIMAILAALIILIGCVAYQAGNIVGGSSGISLFFGGEISLWIVLQGIIAAALLWSGAYKVIEKGLIALVAIMSLAFLITAVMNFPAFMSFLGGFVPGIPDGSILTVIALIGTTVVPYNLFLHSNIVKEKWGDSTGRGEQYLSLGRKDLLLGILVGIAVSVSIMVASATTLGGTGVNSIASMATPLQETLGPIGSSLFGIGLWAAGTTSAITAPLAAAYTIVSALKPAKGKEAAVFRATWIIVLISGISFALTSTSPMILILVAQALNGLLLPFITVFLVFAINRRTLGKHKNGLVVNIFAIIILLIVFLLGIRYLLRTAGIW